MKAKLRKGWSPLYHIKNGKLILGKNEYMIGDCAFLKGDCTFLRGECSNMWGEIMVRGDCTNIIGNCNMIHGDLDRCEITDEERKKGINIQDLISKENVE